MSRRDNICNIEGCSEPKAKNRGKCLKHQKEWNHRWYEENKTSLYFKCKAKRAAEAAVKAPTEGDARRDFVYENGYKLTAIDMGGVVKLQFESRGDCTAILLPPLKQEELANWLAVRTERATDGQTYKTKYIPPNIERH